MAKAHWVTCYRSIRNPAAVQAYAKLAGRFFGSLPLGDFRMRNFPMRRSGRAPNAGVPSRSEPIAIAVDHEDRAEQLALAVIPPGARSP